MFEAPPPPMDAPVVITPDAQSDAQPDASADARRDTISDAGVSEAGALDTGTSDTKPIFDTVVFKDQGGMMEAPPPPMDAAIVKRD